MVNQATYISFSVSFVAWLETIQCGENPKGNKEIWESREMS